MNCKKNLITGGAGFVGSNLATLFKRHYKDITVTAFDNLKRRGSELTLTRLKEHGIRFVHGDIRCPEDFDALPAFDLIIDCSAEPSVSMAVTSTKPTKKPFLSFSPALQKEKTVEVRMASLINMCPL